MSILRLRLKNLTQYESVGVVAQNRYLMYVDIDSIPAGIMLQGWKGDIPNLSACIFSDHVFRMCIVLK